MNEAPDPERIGSRPGGLLARTVAWCTPGGRSVARSRRADVCPQIGPHGGKPRESANARGRAVRWVRPCSDDKGPTLQTTGSTCPSASARADCVA